jgi:hypothetical protein
MLYERALSQAVAHALIKTFPAVMLERIVARRLAAEALQQRGNNAANPC